MKNKENSLNKGKDKNNNFALHISITLLSIILFVVIFTFITINKSHADNIKKENEIMNNSRNSNQIKNATPDECKKKGLHYIGNLIKARYRHNVLSIGNDKIFIIGGYSQTKKQVKDYGEKVIVSDNNDIEERNAEIFNLNTMHSQMIRTIPERTIYTNLYKINDSNIILMPSNLEIYDMVENKFNKLNIKNKVLYQNCIKNNKDYIICLNNDFPIIDILKINDGSLIKRYSLDSHIPVPYNQCQKGIMKNDEDEYFFYYYVPSFSNIKNTIHFFKFNIKNSKKDIKKYDVSIEGQIFTVHKISKMNILISSFFINTKDVYNLYLYNANMNEFTYYKTLNDKYTPICFDNGDILFYRQNGVGNIKIEYIYKSETNKIQNININIPLNINSPTICPISNNQILIVGGENIKNGKPIDSMYIFTF